MHTSKEIPELQEHLALSEYNAKVFDAFRDIRSIRTTNQGDIGKVIKNLKELNVPRSAPFTPFLHFLLNTVHDMGQWDLSDIRYLLIADNSFLSEVHAMMEIYSTSCIRYGSIPSFIFLTVDCEYAKDYTEILHMATLANNINVVKYLVIQYGVDVDSKNSKGNTPLTVAVENDFGGLVAYLLGSGADIFATKDSLSVFNVSVKHGHINMLKLLLSFLPEHGKTVSDLIDADGYGLVHKAIDYDQKEILHYLISLVGEDVKDPCGFDLCAYACTQNNFDLAEYLAVTYASLNMKNIQPNSDTLLHLTAHDMLTFGAFRQLINKKQLNVKHKNADGETFLHIAAKYSNPLVIKYYLSLLDKNEVPNILSLFNKNGQTFLHLLLKENSNYLLEILQRSDISVLEKYINEPTLLEYIAIHPNSSQQLLLAAILKIKSKNSQKSALQVIYKPHLVEIFFDLFINEQANMPKWVYAKQNLLHLACIHFDYRKIKDLIVKDNLDINLRNSENYTPLYILLMHNKIDLALTFIHDFNPNLKNIDGQGSSLLHIACEIESEDLIEHCLHNTSLSAMDNNLAGQTPLTILVSKNNQRLLSMVITSFESINQDFAQSIIDEIIAEDGITTLIEEEISESVISEIIDENSNLEAAEVYNDGVRSEVIAVKDALLQNVEDIIDEEQETQREVSAILTATIDEVAEKVEQELVEKRKVSESFTHVLSQVQTVKKQEKNNDLKVSNYTSPLTVDVSTPQSLTPDSYYSQENYLQIKYEDLTRDILIDAVRRRDYNFFRDIPKNDDKIKLLLASCAVDLLLNAIDTGDQQFTLYLLSIHSIRAEAHTLNNAVFEKARINHQGLVYRNLLTITEVQKAILPKGKKVTYFPEIYPECYKSPKYRVVIKNLERIKRYEKYQKLGMFITGSGLVKRDPNDLDIVLPNSESLTENPLFFEFIQELLVSGARILTNLQDDGLGYLSPRINPQRRIVSLEWLNCKLQFILTKQTIQEYAYSVLTTVTAGLFDLTRGEMLAVEGIRSIQDRQDKIINTVCIPEVSFNIDLSRVLKLVNMLATSPVGFDFSANLRRVIYNLFNSKENPFFSNNINISKVQYYLSEMFSVADNSMHFEILFHSKILSHLINYLAAQKDDVSPEYLQDLRAGLAIEKEKLKIQRQQKIEEQNWHDMYVAEQPSYFYTDQTDMSDMIQMSMSPDNNVRPYNTGFFNPVGNCAAYVDPRLLVSSPYQFMLFPRVNSDVSPVSDVVQTGFDGSAIGQYN